MVQLVDEIFERCNIPIFFRNGTCHIKIEENMTLSDNQKEIMKEEISAELVSLLVKNWGYSTEEAMDVLYNSDMFSRLEDNSTGFYYQSPGYVYSYLDKELSTGDYRS